MYNLTKKIKLSLLTSLPNLVKGLSYDMDEISIKIHRTESKFTISFYVMQKRMSEKPFETVGNPGSHRKYLK